MVGAAGLSSVGPAASAVTGMLLAGVPVVFLYKSENFGFTFRVDGSQSNKNQLRPEKNSACMWRL